MLREHLVLAAAIPIGQLAPRVGGVAQFKNSSVSEFVLEVEAVVFGYSVGSYSLDAVTLLPTRVSNPAAEPFRGSSPLG